MVAGVVDSVSDADSVSAVVDSVSGVVDSVSGVVDSVPVSVVPVSGSGLSIITVFLFQILIF